MLTIAYVLQSLILVLFLKTLSDTHHFLLKTQFCKRFLPKRFFSFPFESFLCLLMDFFCFLFLLYFILLLFSVIEILLLPLSIIFLNRFFLEFQSCFQNFWSILNKCMSFFLSSFFLQRTSGGRYSLCLRLAMLNFYHKQILFI